MRSLIKSFMVAVGLLGSTDPVRSQPYADAYRIPNKPAWLPHSISSSDTDLLFQGAVVEGDGTINMEQTMLGKAFWEWPDIAKKLGYKPSREEYMRFLPIATLETKVSQIYDVYHNKLVEPATLLDLLDLASYSRLLIESNKLELHAKALVLLNELFFVEPAHVTQFNYASIAFLLSKYFQLYQNFPEYNDTLPRFLQLFSQGEQLPLAINYLLKELQLNQHLSHFFNQNKPSLQLNQCYAFLNAFTPYPKLFKALIKVDQLITIFQHMFVVLESNPHQVSPLMMQIMLNLNAYKTSPIAFKTVVDRLGDRIEAVLEPWLTCAADDINKPFYLIMLAKLSVYAVPKRFMIEHQEQIIAMFNDIAFLQKTFHDHEVNPVLVLFSEMVYEQSFQDALLENDALFGYLFEIANEALLEPGETSIFTLSFILNMSHHPSVILEIFRDEERTLNLLNDVDNHPEISQTVKIQFLAKHMLNPVVKSWVLNKADLISTCEELSDKNSDAKLIWALSNDRYIQTTKINFYYSYFLIAGNAIAVIAAIVREFRNLQASMLVSNNTATDHVNLQARLHLAEKRIAELQKATKKVKDLEQQLKDEKKKHLEQIGKLTKELGDTKAKLQQKQAAAQEPLDAYQARIDQLEKRLAEQTAALTSINAQKTQVDKYNARLLTQISKLQQVDQSSKKASPKKSKLKEALQTIEALKKTIDQQRADIEFRNNQIRDLTERLSKNAEKLAKLVDDKKQLGSELQKKEKAIAALELKLTEQTREKDSYKTSQGEIHQKKQTLQKECDQLKRALRKNEQQIITLEDEKQVSINSLASLQAQLALVEKEKQQQQTQLEQLTTELTASQVENDGLQQALKLLKQQQIELEKELAALRPKQPTRASTAVDVKKLAQYRYGETVNQHMKEEERVALVNLTKIAKALKLVFQTIKLTIIAAQAKVCLLPIHDYDLVIRGDASTADLLANYLKGQDIMYHRIDTPKGININIMQLQPDLPPIDLVITNQLQDIPIVIISSLFDINFNVSQQHAGSVNVSLKQSALSLHPITNISALHNYHLTSSNLKNFLKTIWHYTHYQLFNQLYVPEQQLVNQFKYIFAKIMGDFLTAHYSFQLNTLLDQVEPTPNTQQLPFYLKNAIATVFNQILAERFQLQEKHAFTHVYQMLKRNAPSLDTFFNNLAEKMIMHVKYQELAYRHPVPAISQQPQYAMTRVVQPGVIPRGNVQVVAQYGCTLMPGQPVNMGGHPSHHPNPQPITGPALQMMSGNGAS